MIDADVALVGANIKYKLSVYAGSRLVTKVSIKQRRPRKYIVWVMIYNKQVEVFRGKFLLVECKNIMVKAAFKYKLTA